ncbi:hypothetical protein DH2020_011955 [Rehmannia glutinosa]|uniref:Uncharacterized protein n=1 Tax=Rehmannia glutinosa TaxID=99300 RepID=A0ABR0XET2_REHGL
MFTNSDSTDHNPISNQDSPLIFSNFPSPFFDEHELPLNQILPPHYNPVLMAPDQNNSGFTKKETAKRGVKTAASKSKEKADNVNQPMILRRRNLGVVPRKRSGKKDRHSKICTAQGIRDRRMRLSLQVARKFFDLQDLLGYDKASNTIEWLFSKSKKAIKDLMTKDIVNYPPQLLGNNNFSISDAKSESFISECEVVSGIEECSNNELSKQNMEKPRKIAEKPNLRESREKARARARCRTREKMMIKLRGLDNSSPNYHNDVRI